MFGAVQAIKLVLIIMVVIVVAAGIWHISNLKADLAISQMNEQVLKDNIKSQSDLIASIQEDMRAIQATNKELQDQAAKHAEEVKALTDKFNVNAKGEARDFGALAASKPGLIERLINRGTVNAMRCLEIASGAELTEKELNAKLTSEINRECPSIANPNYTPTTP